MEKGNKESVRRVLEAPYAYGDPRMGNAWYYCPVCGDAVPEDTLVNCCNNEKPAEELRVCCDCFDAVASDVRTDMVSDAVYGRVYAALRELGLAVAKPGGDAGIIMSDDNQKQDVVVHVDKDRTKCVGGDAHKWSKDMRVDPYGGEGVYCTVCGMDYAEQLMWM